MPATPRRHTEAVQRAGARGERDVEAVGREVVKEERQLLANLVLDVAGHGCGGAVNGGPKASRARVSA